VSSYTVALLLYVQCITDSSRRSLSALLYALCTRTTVVETVAPSTQAPTAETTAEASTLVDVPVTDAPTVEPAATVEPTAEPTVASSLDGWGIDPAAAETAAPTDTTVTDTVNNLIAAVGAAAGNGI
jgi:hypothetical protein